MIELFLYRVYLKTDYTIGNLSIGEDFFCNTLEDAVRDLNKDGDLEDYGEIKIPGETAIPYGRYPVILTFSPKFKRILPLIIDIKHFSGIRIHRGNSAKDTSGCILVGENSTVGKLTRSAYFETKLTKLLTKYIQAGNKIFINIV